MKSTSDSQMAVIYSNRVSKDQEKEDEEELDEE